MFVVRRRAGERILIAGDIEIEVLEISRSRVKLGIRASREVPVTRMETLPVAAENRAASAWVAAQVNGQQDQLLQLLRNLHGEPAQTRASAAEQ